MIFNSEMLSNLRASVKARLSAKRYEHTIGVEAMASRLGRILMPDKIYELRAAALLHDISKEIPYEEQVDLLSKSTVVYTDEDLSVKPALHSISAVPIIEKDFSEFATKDVLSAVANHTLGEGDMSIFDEIIFLSDYTEEGRTYPTCRQVREYLLDNIREENALEENLFALHSATLDAIEFTIESLRKRGEKIHQKTLVTKSYFQSIISKR